MNILITSVGRRGYVIRYFAEALGSAGEIHTTNSIADCTGAHASRHFHLSPPIESDDYIPFILNIVSQHKIQLVLSLFDQDLLKLSQNKHLFAEHGARLGVSDHTVITTTFDKLAFCNLLDRLHLPTPRTFRTLAAARNALHTKDLSLPLILKPRWGTGSIATEIASSERELTLLYESLTHRLRRTYIAVPSGSSTPNEILIQQFINGEEYHLDVINDLDGRYVTTLAKKKLAMRAGETDAATTVHDPALTEIGHFLAQQLKHVLVLDMDVIKTPQGHCYTLDANPRFGGGYPFSHAAGANIPAAIISWCRGVPPEPQWLTAKEGVTSLKDITLLTYSSDPKESVPS